MIHFYCLFKILKPKIEVIQNVHVLVFPKHKSGEYENGNRSKAEYAVVGLDSLGEVRSLRVEKS